jgi:hypothetical protein
MTKGYLKQARRDEHCTTCATLAIADVCEELRPKFYEHRGVSKADAS